MTDLGRLVDECESDFERALLEAGRMDTSAERKGRVLAALGVGTAIALSGKTSLAMTTAAWKQSLLAGLVVCGGVVGVVAYRASTVETAEPASDPVVFAPELNQRVRRSMNEAEPVRRVEDLPEVAPEPKELEQAEAPRREPPRAAMPVQKSSEPVEKDNPGLNEEIALLDAARAAVNAGRPTEALERLDDHSRRFPKGSLALEAEVVRVQALAAAGRSEEASRRAKRVLSRSPNSVVAARLRRYVLE